LSAVGLSGAVVGAAAPVWFRRRPERSDDEAFLWRLFRQSRPPGEELAGLPDDLRDKLLRQQFVGQARSYAEAWPQAYREIVENNAEPCGRLIASREPGAIVIVDVALLPEHRGRGLGTRLFEALGVEAGVESLRLRLSASATNLAAQRLYFRLGFVVVERSPTAIRFEKTPPVDAGADRGRRASAVTPEPPPRRSDAVGARVYKGGGA
jgi:ribosomal protein S18 acetylase RimI-like enzyme